MSKLLLAAGVAALAITTPVSAKPGGNGGGGHGGQSAQPHGGGDKGHGGGHGDGGFKSQSRGGGHAMKMDRGGGHAMKMDRGGGHAPKFDRHGGGMRMSYAHPDRGHAKAKHSDRSVARAFARAEKHDSMKMRHAPDRQAFRDSYRDQRRLRTSDRDFARTVAWNDRDRWTNGGFADGCPPGLAKKNNGCLPPGQARKLIGLALPTAYASGYLPERLRDLYRDDDDHYFRYGDGYLYRVDRRSNLVNSLFPLFGGGYTIGDRYAAGYSDYGMPSYYEPFYQDSPYDYYRYNNGYVYDIDRRSGLIENIIPALGYGYGVGEMMPASYSYYNLPYQYRDVYADNDDYYYRYAPGAIYQVDRDTSLITSVASLLTGGTGLGIGQQLPMGYSAYNVPYQYRDQYYDTPDAMYRYANGNIYQVDPTTQLITAVINALV